MSRSRNGSRTLHLITRKGTGLAGLWLPITGPVGAKTKESAQKMLETMFSTSRREEFEVIKVRVELDAAIG